jgi:hypothetical protein
VPVIYAAPFIFMGLVAAAACAIVPRWRRYALRAFLLPPAFAVSAIIGYVIIVLLFEAAQHPVPALDGRMLLLIIPIYILPGVVGGWLALIIVSRYVLRRSNRGASDTSPHPSS